MDLLPQLQPCTFHCVGDRRPLLQLVAIGWMTDFHEAAFPVFENLGVFVV